MQKKVLVKSKHGFTLTELMVIVGIIAILAAIALPGIMKWLPNMRLTTSARDLYATLQKAKIEAVRRNNICVLVFNQNIGGTNFSYVLFEDQNGNIEFDATEPIISQVKQLPKSVSFDTSQGGGDGITFINNDDGNPAIGFTPTTLPVYNGPPAVPAAVPAAVPPVPNGTGVAWLKAKNRSLRVDVSLAGSISIK